jgi:hypothetical protein
MTPSRSSAAAFLLPLYTAAIALGASWYFWDRRGPWPRLALDEYGTLEISPFEILDEHAPMNILVSLVLSPLLAHVHFKVLQSRRRGSEGGDVAVIRSEARLGAHAFLHVVSCAAITANAIFYLPENSAWFTRPRGTFTLTAAVVSGFMVVVALRRRAGLLRRPSKGAPILGEGGSGSLR